MKKHFDYPLFFLVCFLMAFGLVFLACLSSYSSLQKYGNTSYYLTHQFVLAVLAIAFGLVAYKIPLPFLKKWAPLLVFLSLAGLFLVFMPGIGTKIYGASRWITIAGHSFQPSEILKITSILYLAAWVSSRLSEMGGLNKSRGTVKNYHNFFYILFPFLVFLGTITIGLYLQKDATTLGIITITLFVIYFSAKTPFWHTFVIVLLGLLALFILVKFTPYRLDRLSTFLNPDEDPLGSSYQVKQSLISLGSGGFIGKGLGLGNQKFGRLPMAMNDAMFSVVGEELGFIGSAGIVVLFCLFFWFGIRIAQNSTDKFSKLTAIGITFWITLQAFINMASAIGIFPFVGIPLPFLSYGGSHLLIEMVGIGILLNISKNG